MIIHLNFFFRETCDDPICQPVYWCKQCSGTPNQPTYGGSSGSSIVPTYNTPVSGNSISANSQDSYGSPQAPPVSSPDSYGSPQAAPVSSPDSYGSPQAAPDSYSSPIAPTAPALTVAL